MEPLNTVRILKIYRTQYWVERDMLGSNRIMMQHENMKPFCYAILNYNYAYTSNAGMQEHVIRMMKSFGIAEKDIVWKTRDIEFES